MPALAIIGGVLGAVGTGLSFSAQMNAAKTQSVFSNLNAQAGIQQAQQQGAIGSLQAQLQAQTAKTQQQSDFNNAEALRAQADNDARIAQESTRRGRDEFARQLAAANAQAGGSGVNVATGSPLDFLMKKASQEQQTEQDQQYQTNAGRVAGYRQAAGQELGGNVQGMNSSLFQLQSLSAVEEGRMGAIQARLGGLAGGAQAQGLRNSAFGGLISGGANTLNQFGSNPWWQPWKK